jgi:hypothetical protein
MEAGGGAVAAPPQNGQLADRQAAGRRGRKSVRTFWARFFFFSFFLSFLSPISRLFSKKKGDYLFWYLPRAADPGT